MPSTPNARSIRTAPSTTPLHPPPSWLTNKSNTPPGPPPNATFGSSFNPSNNTFNRKNASFEVPGDDGYDDEDADGEMEHVEGVMGIPALPPQSFASSMPGLSPPPRGLKRDHQGKVRPQSEMVSIAKGMVNKGRRADVRETDEVIVQGEQILAEMNAKVRRQPTDAYDVAAQSATQLTRLWRQNSDLVTKSGSIGPKSKDNFSKANYVASLLLALHHPHSEKHVRLPVSDVHSALVTRGSNTVTVPRALLEWLETYHKPFADDYEVISACHPSPSAHESFWDVVFGSTLRGRLDRVIQLLQNAGWRHAATAADDYPEEGDPQYEGHQLDNTYIVVSSCIEIIQSCPGLRQNNWDVKGMEWSLYRSRVHNALDDLEVFAEGDGGTSDYSKDNLFQRSVDQNSMSLSQQNRRATSKVPWSIYENLKLLYGLILGSTDEILMTAQDWLEGSLYLTIWWDGSDEDGLEGSLHRSSAHKSTAQKPRAVDVNPLDGYRVRLANAFRCVTENPEDSVFTVQTMDMVQVALGCVLEDSVGTVIDFLQNWSMPIAVSIVEIAATGLWLPSVRQRSTDDLMDQGFSKEDLLVLSAGPPSQADPEAVDRDKILGDYADLLAIKPKIADRDGWEVAVTILNRLDNSLNAGQKISELLDKIDLSEEASVDKVLDVCDDLGRLEQRRGIAERFADNLAGRNEDYGAALIYYARAQASSKLKETIVLLTSLSLLHSAAMPVQALLDAKLRGLISEDRHSLKELAKTDLEAATLLSSHLSGYATLRKFYDLRDQDVYIGQGTKVRQPLKSLTRRRAAANALFAVLKSAADCLTGGLYDPEVESVVPPDGILALCGEALPLLGSEDRVLTEQQVFGLLAIVEDFVASPSRIKENADSLLRASLTAYKDGSSTASGVLKKSRSDLSASSWDMIASQSMMVHSQSSGKHSKIQRAWDWRKGLIGMGGAEADANAVVKLVREALVREVAAGWGGKLNW